jgi:hypothetical protein
MRPKAASASRPSTMLITMSTLSVRWRIRVSPTPNRRRLCQDLVDSRISVDDGEDDRVDVRKRLINGLGKYVSGLLIAP